MINSSHITSLYKQQKQCVHILGNLKNSENTDSIFKKLNILKFRNMVQLEMCKLGHQLKLKQLPAPIIDEFNAGGGFKTH